MFSPNIERLLRSPNCARMLFFPNVQSFTLARYRS